MARTIVICCDGTGNTFDGEPTNVTRLIRFLDLSDPQRQVAVYAQGVGTNGIRISAVRDHGPALQTFTPRESRLGAHTTVLRVLGLGFGYGLQPLVREMYRRLAGLHTDADDRIYLFGFSRGAFAVRALAGLIYRCGLPERVDRRTFNRAWQLFKPMSVPVAEVRAFRELSGNRSPEIEFLGVWDTVKSYGGLVPTRLPHLRHNPIVRHVAHALALHERRAWFKATTWGQLDMDKDKGKAMERTLPEDRDRYGAQTIAEVWFTGFHSDVGAGDITLRWMLGEALHRGSGLGLRADALTFLARPDPTPPMTDSSTAVWGLMEQLPRLEIFNDDKWPYRRWVWGSDGAREPSKVLRGEQATAHATNTDASAMGPTATCRTYRPEAP
ncbi:phospholipase effector Tle1 domain-containing protein [Actinoplanes subglobosus]|uniref:Phospholipase effector Tle1 domain-containing protein n=1 Tax=Actinoplanes subglobosus TaxID=1547892 RepID=A0ABV8IH69_9ACTN